MTALQLLMKKDSNQKESNTSPDDLGAIDLALKALSEQLDQASK
jgi:hypothetical protein